MGMIIMTMMASWMDGWTGLAGLGGWVGGTMLMGFSVTMVLLPSFYPHSTVLYSNFFFFVHLVLQGVWWRCFFVFFSAFCIFLSYLIKP